MKLWHLLIVGFLLVAGTSAYMTWLCWQAGDESKWMFGIFTLFFCLLAASPYLPKLRSKAKPEPVNTRFVPHWFMMLAALVLLATVVIAIIGGIAALLVED
jgi:hypothetical protein